MKTSPLLLTELRSLFGFIRGLMILWLVIIPISFVANWHHSEHWTTDLGTIEFNPAIAASRVDSPLTLKPADGVKLRSLTGSLSVSEREDGAKLIAAMRVPVFVNRLARTLILFAIAHLLWRLCKGVEAGEVFSAGNSRLVHWLGVAIVVRPIVGLVFETWQRASVAHYIEDHVRFEGLRSYVSASDVGWWARAIENVTYHGDFDFTLFTTGLLVLALAEVFRRGLTLKQENDLTV